MLSIQTFSLLVLLTILPVCLSHPSVRVRPTRRWDCRGCGMECDKCVYGFTKSVLCGVLECRKGPNEPCGGNDNIRGVCGDGMLCQCGRCTGCSLDTYKCAHENPEGPCRPKYQGLN